ncbi:MAG: anthrone oxygenase family protein [Rubrobacteraceae bacterium]
MLERVLRFLCMLWVGVMAGFFFAFTVLVMPGLDATEPLAAMSAMQAINDAVRNALFAIGFFGAMVLCLAVILVSLIRRGGSASWTALAGAVIYIVGVFGVTVGFNVPLNETLATLDPTLPENAPSMTAYIEDWSFWNNVRTLANVLAFGLLASSIAFGRDLETERSSSREVR